MDEAAERDNEAVAATASALLARYGHDPLVVKAVRLLAAGRDELDHRTEDLASLATVLEREGRRFRELVTVAERDRILAEQLADLSELRGAFLLAISHDLRTPLAALSGLAGLLVDDPDLGKDDRERVTLQIRDTAQRIRDLFNDLVDLERVDHRDLVVRRERVDAHALIQDLIDQIDLGARAVVVDASTEPIVVDPLLVGRIVENLLRNVTHHTPDDTDVWVRVRGEPDGYVLVVEDSGPGFDPALSESIFEPFWRNRRAGGEIGLGVGLTLVKRFAELHGGNVHVEPRTGGGASFRVLLPLAEEE